MFNIKKENITLIKEFLDQIGYGFIYKKYLHSLGYFPTIESSKNYLKNLNDFHRLLFTVFIQGHSVEELFLRKHLPNHIFEALRDLGLIINPKLNIWRTPAICILPVYDFYIISGFPKEYTLNNNPKIPFISQEEIDFAFSIPSSVDKRNALDINFGIGLSCLAIAKSNISSLAIVVQTPIQEQILNINLTLNLTKINYQLLNYLPSDFSKYDYIVSKLPMPPKVNDNKEIRSNYVKESGSAYLKRIIYSEGFLELDGANAFFHYHSFPSSNHNDQFEKILEQVAIDKCLLIRNYILDKVSLVSFLESQSINKYAENVFNSKSNFLNDNSNLLEEYAKELLEKDLVIDFVLENLLYLTKGNFPSKIEKSVFAPYLSDPLLNIAHNAKSSNLNN